MKREGDKPLSSSGSNKDTGLAILVPQLKLGNTKNLFNADSIWYSPSDEGRSFTRFISVNGNLTAGS